MNEAKLTERDRVLQYLMNAKALFCCDMDSENEANNSYPLILKLSWSKI